MTLKIEVNDDKELSGTANGVYFVVYKDMLGNLTPSVTLALIEAVDEIATLRAQLAEAVEALKPFAHPDLSEILAGNTVGEESIVYVRNNATLTVKDFRRAAEIINRIIQSND